MNMVWLVTKRGDCDSTIGVAATLEVARRMARARMTEDLAGAGEEHPEAFGGLSLDFVEGREADGLVVVTGYLGENPTSWWASIECRLLEVNQ